MTGLQKATAGFEAPDLSPVIVTERTATGWRGMTQDGMILNVATTPGDDHVRIPESLAVAHNDQIIGYRKVSQDIRVGVIDTYTKHLTAANALVRSNDPEQALREINSAIDCAPTALARYNRSLILLSLGKWQQGIDEFADVERTSEMFMRPQFKAAIDAGKEPWVGQPIRGKTLLLIHDHGFGDSIMCLRYVPMLKAMGANVVLQMPQELHRLATQLAPVTTNSIDAVDAIYVCSILMLMQHASPDTVSASRPYLRVGSTLVDKWRGILGPKKRKRIGIAWAVGREMTGDYPRACPLELFDKHLTGELINVQHRSGTVGYSFDDFADCAALMTLMDEIVTVDTAAVHLAGAIGHPKIKLLLSRWHSWRWRMHLYDNVTLCRQDSPGDWGSAFAKCTASQPALTS